MKVRSAGLALGARSWCMADLALFEFLHTEMVAELWAQDPDPGPGVSAGARGGGRHGPRRSPDRDPGWVQKVV